MSSQRKKLVIAAAAVAITACVFLNIDVVIRQGVNGVYREIHMPLYIKWTQFLARHYEYERTATEITTGLKTDEDKVLALFRWTCENIKPIPEGMANVDDHILNIMIRGYGSSEQAQDVFTNLCVYAQIPAFWQRIHDNSGKVCYALSFVKINGTWRVYDVYNKIYFRTKAGRIASIDDIKSGEALMEKGVVEGITVRGVPYREFYENLGQFKVPAMLRSEKQMPLPRFIFEITKAVRIEHEEEGRQ